MDLEKGTICELHVLEHHDELAYRVTVDGKMMFMRLQVGMGKDVILEYDDEFYRFQILSDTQGRFVQKSIKEGLSEDGMFASSDD